MISKWKLFATGCATALTVGAAGVAQATPYAYASNLITGLTITNANGTAVTPVTATTSISDNAQFDGNPIAGFQARGVVGSPLTIQQAYSGPGAAPAATYTPQPIGTFTGTRADAAITAGTAASGGVGVSNVAEGFGGALGNSVATNNAAITFSTVGTGQQLQIAFSDLFNLITSTAAVPGESASASIQNNISITQSGSNTPLATFSPADINFQISSASGVPTSNTVGPRTFAATFLTPILTSGVFYNIALTSTASESIQPGTATPVPEPMSIGLLGLGLAAIGLIRGRSVT